MKDNYVRKKPKELPPFKKWSPILPQKSCINSKDKKIATLDIEAEGWTQFLVIGFYYLNNNFYMKFYSMREAMNFMFDYCRDNNIKDVFIHNGGKYDINFVIEGCLRETKKFRFHSAIDRGSSFLQTKIEDIENDFILTFRDSIGFIPMSLAKAGESYKVDVVKDSVDFKYIGQAFRDENYVHLVFTDEYVDGKNVKHKRNTVYYNGKEVTSYSIMRDKKDLSKVTYFCHETKTTYRIYTKADIEEYLYKDCVSLAQVIHAHFTSSIIADAGVSFTSAGQAMRIFRRFLDYPIESSTVFEDIFVRKAYKGGRTEVFKFFFDGEYDVKSNPLSLSKETLKDVKKMAGKKIRCYDANSLYPTVMAQFLYPMKFKGIFKGPATVKGMFEKYEYGIFHVKVKVPKTLHIPPLGIEHTFENGTRKYIFPVGVFEGHWTKFEIDYAITLGVEIIEYYECAVYEKPEPIFKNFIDTMYARRREAQKAKDETTSTVTKLAMNSCYGKLGMDLMSKYSLVGRSQCTGNEEVYREMEFDDYDDDEFTHVRMIYKKPSDTAKMSTKVIFACYVTSYARVLMHKEMMKVGSNNIWYTDTDSLFTLEKMTEGTALGEMKLEYEAVSACFLAPKTYLIDDIIDMKYKTKKTMKGFDRFKVESVEPLEFFEYWKGELGEIKAIEKEKFMSFKTASMKGVSLGLLYNEFSEREAGSKRIKMLRRKMSNTKDKNEWNSLNNKVKAINDKIHTLGGTKWKSMKTQYDKRIMCENRIDTIPIELSLH